MSRRMKVRCDSARPVCTPCSKRGKNCLYSSSIARTGSAGRQSIARSEQVHTTPTPAPIRDSGPIGSRPPNGISDAALSNVQSDQIERLVEEKVRQALVRSSFRPVNTYSVHAEQQEATPDESISGPREPSTTSTEERQGQLMYDEIVKKRNNPSFREHMCMFYRSVHNQPLPLLSPSDIEQAVTAGPDWLFVSISLACNLHCIERGRTEVAEIKTVAQNILKRLISREDSDIALAQSLCLLSYIFIQIGDRLRAELSVHAASTFFDATGFIEKDHGQTLNEESLVVRCSQSIYILKCMLIEGKSSCGAKTVGPHPPTRALLLEAIKTHRPGGEPADLGIMTYNTLLYGIWHRAILFLTSFDSLKNVDHWRAESTYHSIKQDLYEWETGLAQCHRVGSANFEKCDLEELERRRDHWAPWFTMQILYHGIQALINHPLLHIIKLGSESAFQPPSFSQHTVDESRLHAAWTCRLVGSAEEVRFSIKDRFIPYVVAATSTVSLFSYFDKDDATVKAAMDSVAACSRFLASCNRSTCPGPYLESLEERYTSLTKSANVLLPGLSRNHPPSAQLVILLPIFSFCHIHPPSRRDLETLVPFPANSDFLTGPNDMPARSASDRERGQGRKGGGNDAWQGNGTDVDMSDGDRGRKELNIFDTSDILNTQLLDGSLWPGQL